MTETTTMTEEKATISTDAGDVRSPGAGRSKRLLGLRRLLAERLLAAPEARAERARAERAGAQDEEKKAAASEALVFWAIPLRVVTLLGFYMILTTTATGLIPMVGMWVHQRSGLPVGEATHEALVAFWLMPYAFVVLMILVGELALFRAMWRGGSNLIATARAKRDRDTAPTPVPATAPATAPAAGKNQPQQNTKQNTKRSK
jgi:hypothetical protein